MLNINAKYVSLFQVEDTGRYVKCTLSTSKKDSDGKYTNMYWNARIVGKAYESAKELKDKDKINILSGVVENKYDKENSKLYLNVTIFEFEKSN